MSARPLLTLSIIATLSGCVIDPAPAARPASFEDVRRVIALLDDVAAEYPHADAVRMQLIAAIALAILTGPPVGRLARSSIEVFGAAAITPLTVAALAVACAVGLGWLIALRSARSVHAVLAAASAALAVAAACGRAAFAVTEGPPLALPRIEALGVMPAAVPVCAIALALAAMALAFAVRLRAASR